MAIIIYPQPQVRHAWADTAQVPTDIIDPGDAFASAGWLQSATPPARQIFNWVLSYCMQGVRYNAQTGITGWNAQELYQSNAVVMYGNILYQSNVANNQGNIPSTSSQWSSLNGYTSTAQLAAALSPYMTSAAFAAAIAAYYTQTQTNTLLNLKANLASPVFTGNPTTTSPATGESSQKIAPASWVLGEISSYLASYYTQAQINTILASYATLNSPQFSGAPTTPTPTAGANNTQVANTAWVHALVLPNENLAGGVKAYPDGTVEQWGTFPAGLNQTPVSFNAPFQTAVTDFTASIGVSTGDAVTGTIGTTVTNLSGGMVYTSSSSVRGRWHAWGY